MYGRELLHSSVCAQASPHVEYIPGVCPRTTAYHLGRLALLDELRADDSLSLLMRDARDVVGIVLFPRLRPERLAVSREDCVRLDFRPFCVTTLNECSVLLLFGSPLLAAAECLAYRLDLLLLLLPSMLPQTEKIASALCAVALTFEPSAQVCCALSSTLTSYVQELCRTCCEEHK